MSVFEEVVLFLGRRQAIGQLAREVGVEDTEPARVGVVLSLPVVLANLDQWLETTDTVAPPAHRSGGRKRARSDWLLDRLEAVEPGASADFRSLADDLETRRLGAEVLDLILGQRRDDVTEKIATRAGTSPGAADGLLCMTSAAVLAHLANHHRSSIGGEAMADELAQERHLLVAGGWSPWMAETERSPGSTSPVGRSEPGPSAYPPPVARHQAVDLAGPTATVRGRSLPAVDDDPNRVARAAAPHPAPVSDASGQESDDPSDEAGRSSGSPADQPRSRSTIGYTPAAGQPRPQRERRSGRRIEPAPVLVFTGLAIAAALAGFALFSLLTGSDGDGSELVTGDGTADVDATTPLTASSVAGTEVGPDPASTSADGDGGAVAPLGGPLIVPLADPLGLTEGTGTAELTFDSSTGEICYAFEVDGVAGPYDGHIHVGPVGVKGGIVVDFGELEGNPSGCIENTSAGTEAILADLEGHYVEFHDADGVTTVRAQLSGADTGVAAAEAAEDEPATGGAVVKIEVGRLVLNGEVPDQVTIDKLLETFADIDLGSTELVNELTVVPGSPRPSGNIVVDDAIFFEFDSDQLVDPESTVLTDLATIFQARPAWSMTVVGHTDSTGTDVYNLELSLRRAAAVRDALIAAGVAEDALTIVGAGSTEPIAANDTAEGRAQNRRIEIEVTPG